MAVTGLRIASLFVTAPYKISYVGSRSYYMASEQKPRFTLSPRSAGEHEHGVGTGGTRAVTGAVVGYNNSHHVATRDVSLTSY